ncbi:uncharacterized protein LOC117896113 [Drosophila subobscura]|uniref:uncharacterized protein LOC117896113 n=1 Tax=Drosophila subobscura TaxID=7241 RepID=UPI00155A1EBC|nr:uncharacterized protein LOC117896113 [Drosophila subobscura]
MSCLPKWIFKIYCRVFRILPDMGDMSSKNGVFGLLSPSIAKLGDEDNYWTWRILIRSYLEALGLWAGNFPKEGPQTKFILLSTLEMWIFKREYEHSSCKQIFQDLEERFSVPRPKLSQMNLTN